MINSPNMGLSIWDSVTDTWSTEEFADNLRKIDEHDHAMGRGRQIPTGGIEDGAITMGKLSAEASTVGDGTIRGKHLADGAVTHPKLAVNSVNTINIRDNAVSRVKVRDTAISSPKLAKSVREATATHDRARSVRTFTPGTGAARSTSGYLGSPRTGPGDTLKVTVPAGGSILFVHAQGKGKAEGGTRTTLWGVDPCLTITGPSISYERVSIGQTDIKGAKSFEWFGSPVSFSSRRTSAGAPVAFFVPGGGNVQVRLELNLHVSTGSVTMAQQTLAVWTMSIPDDWPLT